MPAQEKRIFCSTLAYRQARSTKVNGSSLFLTDTAAMAPGFLPLQDSKIVC